MQNKGIIGTVCGDIIGSAYEFHKTKDWNFKLFTPRSTFTDDTVMTCAVAEWLMDDLEHTHEQLVKIMHRYGEEYPHKGYGGMFGRWLRNHGTKPYNSFGNGSAMRVSPTGYYAKSFDEALQLAQISAEVTHNHPEGIIGAQAVAACIFLIRNNEPYKIKDYLEKHCFYNIEKIGENWETIRHKYEFDETCQGSVPEAIYCALKNMDSPCGYERTVREAVSLGGDADTQGAIAGGIAAAVCEVPDDILGECLDRLDSKLADVISRFNEVCNQNNI